METKKTSLYQLHHENSAKFVEFAGYQMPIQYSDGIVEEHKFTRSHAGIFDVSHMGQLFIYGGDDLVKDLEKIFPLDLKNLAINHSKYSFLMNDEAGIYDDLIITKIEKGFLIILNAACKDNDFKIISELLNDKYKMDLDKKRSLIAIQGPKSSEILNYIIKGVIDLNFMSGGVFKFQEQKVYVTRSGYTGEDGFEVSIINELAENFTKKLIDKGAKLIGLGARDTLRLEAGMNLYGFEMDDSISPFECNMAWTVDFSDEERKFYGKEALTRILKDDKQYELVGLMLEERAILRQGQKVYFDADKELEGVVTSGTYSPTLKKPIALARIPSISAKSCFTEMRGKEVFAKIGSPRFIREGKEIFKERI